MSVFLNRPLLAGYNSHSSTKIKYTATSILILLPKTQSFTKGKSQNLEKVHSVIKGFLKDKFDG